MSGEETLNNAGSGQQHEASVEPLLVIESSPHAHQKPPEHVTQQLSGYLSKQGKGIKSWRTKWCVFDEQRCCLHYYLAKEDFKPQG
ncbi:hypothetical protein EMCRGX_G023288 [Ephydatia muelleri]